MYIQDYEEFKKRVSDKYSAEDLVAILGLSVEDILEEMYDTVRPLIAANWDDFGDCYD